MKKLLYIATVLSFIVVTMGCENQQAYEFPDTPEDEILKPSLKIVAEHDFYQGETTAISKAGITLYVNDELIDSFGLSGSSSPDPVEIAEAYTLNEGTYDIRFELSHLRPFDWDGYTYSTYGPIQIEAKNNMIYRFVIRSNRYGFIEKSLYERETF